MADGSGRQTLCVAVFCLPSCSMESAIWSQNTMIVARMTSQFITGRRS